MIENTLLAWTPGIPELLIILIIGATPALLIIFFIKYVIQTNRERRLMRLEVGKLADELQQLKKQLK